jgi:5-methylcytosine-specific restriction endonuclease McrA
VGVSEHAFVFPSDLDGTVQGMAGIEIDLLSVRLKEGRTVREIAAELGRSQKSVRYWLRRHGLETPRAVGRARADAGERETTRTCRKHGSTTFVLEGRGYYRCGKCRGEHVAASRRNRRRGLIEEAGGECSICGYDRCVGALEFHHLDPADKEFGLSWRGLTRSLEDLRREARKCILLCSNCHAEVEAGVTALPTKASIVPLSSGPGAE